MITSIYDLDSNKSIQEVDMDRRICPFCSNQAAWIEKEKISETLSTYKVKCLNCHASTGWYLTFEAAINVWNGATTVGLGNHGSRRIKTNSNGIKLGS